MMFIDPRGGNWFTAAEQEAKIQSAAAETEGVLQAQTRPEDNMNSGM